MPYTPQTAGNRDWVEGDTRKKARECGGSFNPRRVQYNQQGWPLCKCVHCAKRNYVEPHGTTAYCGRCKMETEHEPLYTAAYVHVKP